LLLELDAVAAGELDTGLIARVLDDLQFADPSDRVFAEASLLLARQDAARAPDSVWGRATGWRLGGGAPSRFRLSADGKTRTVAVGPGERVRVDAAEPTDGAVIAVDGLTADVRVAGEVRRFPALVRGDGVDVAFGGAVFSV